VPSADIPAEEPELDPLAGVSTPAYFAWAGQHMPDDHFLQLYGTRIRKYRQVFAPDPEQAAARAISIVRRTQPNWNQGDNPEAYAAAAKERHDAGEAAREKAHHTLALCSAGMARLESLIASAAK
jgi:hypothetical protein